MSNFMLSAHDFRTVLLFRYHLKKKAVELHQMLVEAYGDNALSRAHCYRWFEKFQNGDFDVRNDKRGRPAKNLKMLNYKHYSMKRMSKRKNILQNN
ncbi:hypothetical protein TNCV_458771 [Trichonephila clavipes]|nr:hypothetical protein TNCV_458771 [Trichonephila clavipes]